MTPLARTILFSVAIYVSAFAFFLLSQADFVLTDFAILDDLSYFHAYLVGEAVAVPTNFLPYVLLDIAAKLNSVSAIKIVSLGSLATITTLFALCLRTITARPLFSAIGRIQTGVGCLRAKVFTAQPRRFDKVVVEPRAGSYVNHSMNFPAG